MELDINIALDENKLKKLIWEEFDKKEFYFNKIDKNLLSDGMEGTNIINFIEKNSYYRWQEVSCEKACNIIDECPLSYNDLYPFLCFFPLYLYHSICVKNCSDGMEVGLLIALESLVESPSEVEERLTKIYEKNKSKKQIESLVKIKLKGNKLKLSSLNSRQKELCYLALKYLQVNKISEFHINDYDKNIERWKALIKTS